MAVTPSTITAVAVAGGSPPPGSSVISGPAVEPVLYTAVVAHSRLPTPTPGEITQINLMITAAREKVEETLWRTLITQSRRQAMDHWPHRSWHGSLRPDDPDFHNPNPIEPDYPPLQSVDSITYLDTAGDRQTVDSSIYDVTRLDLYGRITLADGQVWPTNRGDAESIQINYVAGYGDAASNVPAMIRLALLQIVANWWEFREEIITGTIVAKIPDVAMAALNPFIARRLV